MGLLEVLLVIFVTLKLCGVIAWSWGWVLAPLWGVFALYGATLAFIAFANR